LGNVGSIRSEGREKKHEVDAHIKELSLWHTLPPLSLFGALDLGNLYVCVYAYIRKGKNFANVFVITCRSMCIKEFRGYDIESNLYKIDYLVCNKGL
jgi:hypothetical protein